MDKKTQQELNRITRSIPKELIKNLSKRVVDTSEEDYARQQLKRGDIPPAVKNKISAMIDRGAFRREEDVVNEKVVKELDKYHQERINSARRAGKLGDPTSDRFVRERMERMKKR